MEQRRTTTHLIRHILRYEILGFGLILLMLWVDEILDLPRYLFQAQPTPINLAESLFETLLVIIIGLLTVILTSNLLHYHLRGFLIICSSCKKIRDDNGEWIQMEGYIRDHSSADFSHSICPNCKEKLYPGLNAREKSPPQ